MTVDFCKSCCCVWDWCTPKKALPTESTALLTLSKDKRKTASKTTAVSIDALASRQAETKVSPGSLKSQPIPIPIPIPSPRTVLWDMHRFLKGTHIHLSYPFNPRPETVNMLTGNVLAPKRFMEKWVEAHESILNAERYVVLATKLTKLVEQHFVSFEKFQEELRKSVEAFNRNISKNKYIIVIPGEEDQSNHWVTALALQYLDHPPIAILGLDVLALNSLLRADPEITEIVTFDDAAYTGHQMRHWEWDWSLGLNLHIVIPFVTRLAKGILERSVYQLHNTDHIPHLSDLFSKDELELLPKSDLAEEPGYLSRKGFVVFAHKLPDHHSILLDYQLKGERLLNGDLVEEEGTALVLAAKPPYKR